MDSMAVRKSSLEPMRCVSSTPVLPVPMVGVSR